MTDGLSRDLKGRQLPADAMWELSASDDLDRPVQGKQILSAFVDAELNARMRSYPGNISYPHMPGSLRHGFHTSLRAFRRNRE